MLVSSVEKSVSVLNVVAYLHVRPPSTSSCAYDSLPTIAHSTCSDQSRASSASGRYRQRVTKRLCAKYSILPERQSSEYVVSSVPVQLSRTVFRRIYMLSLTATHSKTGDGFINDLGTILRHILGHNCTHFLTNSQIIFR